MPVGVNPTRTKVNHQPELNPTYGEVTNRAKLGEWMYQAVILIKCECIEPRKFYTAEVDTVCYVGRQHY